MFGIFGDISLQCERGQSGLTCFLVVIFFLILKMELGENSQCAEEWQNTTCQEIFLFFVYLKKKPTILAETPGLYHTLAGLWRLQLLLLVQGQDKH